MKFFHLSDLHIGLKLCNRDLGEDQQEILQQVIKAAAKEKPDAIVIAGDLYDKGIPTAEAVTLFDRFMEEITKAVPDTEIMIISGNHDSAPRVNVFRSVLQGRKIHMIGMPPTRPDEHIEKVILSDEYGSVNFYLLPFVKPSMVKMIVGTNEEGDTLSYNDTLHRLIEREEIDQEERNVLVSHQFYLPIGMRAEEIDRMDSEIRTVGNIDEVRGDILERFDYAALGHIHKAMKVGKEVYRYSGTPLSCSVGEAGQQKEILVVELKEKGSVDIKGIPFRPLREVRVIKGELEQVLKEGCSDYVSVVLTDQVDLDVVDMQDRLRQAFPFLLEIRREFQRKSHYAMELTGEKELDTYELCSSFLKDLDAEEEKILKEIIDTIREGM